MTTSFMDRLADFITTCQYDHIPKELVLEAKYAILDTLGVSLAGWNEPVVEIIKHTYPSSSGSKDASLWGEVTRVELEHAAFINGAASHALDYDDVSTRILAHPSAPILASVIPMVEYARSSGKDVITAYVIGTEVMIKLGTVMGFRHYDLGWHATDTLGTVGAAAASAYLLRLNAGQTAHAIGIAASTAGGLQKNFGTMTKPLHVGIASHHGIQAALLARSGLTSNRDIFEKRGFFFSFSGGQEQGELNRQLDEIEFGQPFSLLESGLSVKKFPCCYLTHRIIQGCLEIRQETDLRLQDVESIEIVTPPGGMVPLIHPRPQTGLHGKFSAEYTALAAITDGDVGFATFEDEQVLRPEIQQLLSKVQATEEVGVILTAEEMDQKPVQIKIKTNSGLVEKRVLHTPGSPERPMSEEERRGKWRDCFAFWMSNRGNKARHIVEQHADNLFDLGLRIEELEDFTDYLQILHNPQEINR